MGMGSKYYDLEEYITNKRTQGKDFRHPPRANVFAAADHVRSLLDKKSLDGSKIAWAAMGGLAMTCLGSRREIVDIHIVYDDRCFPRLLVAAQAGHRLRIPEGISVSYPSKILVSTGPIYKDVGCTAFAEVEANLIPAGTFGTPPSDLLVQNQVVLRANRSGQTHEYKGLNMFSLVKSTLALYRNRDLIWDPRKDLLFLCQSYPNDIGSIRHRLNPREIHENFLNTPFFSRLSPSDQRLCCNVLLNKEPPPAMAITVPQHGNKGSASGINPISKDRMGALNPTQPLAYGLRPKSSFLTPELPTRATAAVAQTLKPNAQDAHFLSDDRESRSRNRQNSAPQKPKAEHSSTSSAAEPRARSADSRVRYQRDSTIVQTAQPVSKVAQNFSRPQVVEISSPNSMRSKKSLSDVKYTTATRSSEITEDAPKSSHTNLVAAELPATTRSSRTNSQPTLANRLGQMHQEPTHTTSNSVGSLRPEALTTSQPTVNSITAQHKSTPTHLAHEELPSRQQPETQPRYQAFSKKTTEEHHTSARPYHPGATQIPTVSQSSHPLSGNSISPPTQAPASGTINAFRPDSTHAPSISIDNVPMSLMIGGPKQRTPSNSISHTQPGSMGGVAQYQVQAYFSPPSSAPGSKQPSPQISPYKAYSRPISPLENTAMAPANSQQASSSQQSSVQTQTVEIERPRALNYGAEMLPPSHLKAVGPQRMLSSQILPYQMMTKPPTPVSPPYIHELEGVVQKASADGRNSDDFHASRKDFRKSYVPFTYQPLEQTPPQVALGASQVQPQLQPPIPSQVIPQPYVPPQHQLQPFFQHLASEGQAAAVSPLPPLVAATANSQPADAPAPPISQPEPASKPKPAFIAAPKYDGSDYDHILTPGFAAHQRNISNVSTSSTASEQMAAEYRLELPHWTPSSKNLDSPATATKAQAEWQKDTAWGKNGGLDREKRWSEITIDFT